MGTAACSEGFPFRLQVSEAPQPLGLGFPPEERLSSLFLSSKAPGSQGLGWEGRPVWEAGSRKQEAEAQAQLDH